MAEKISSRQNKTVKYIRELAKDRALRREMKEFVCDGEKLFSEAIRAEAEIGLVLCTEAFLGEIPGELDKKTYIVNEDILESVTTLKGAQNVIFTCRMKSIAPEKLEKVIMLDRLQDTGNIGTIIRTADAFGVNAVFEDGCADIYNPKTIRSAMGSVFRVPVVSCDFTSEIPKLRMSGIPVFASELYGDVKTVDELDFARLAVVIGNEGSGVRREVSQLCDGSVIIPMQGKAESLNAAVAAAVFMFKMSQNNG